jgi:effector-binding domain-containing protein
LLPATPAVVIAEPVNFDDSMDWWGDVFAELYGALEAAGIEASGSAGALYSGEFFEEQRGEVVAFVPVPEGSRGPRRQEVPGAEYAVTVYEGPFAELDKAYGALGEFVAEREIGIEGPIRENYLVSSLDTDDESRHRTEVCWPIFHTGRG